VTSFIVIAAFASQNVFVSYKCGFNSYYINITFQKL